MRADGVLERPGNTVLYDVNGSAESGQNSLTSFHSFNILTGALQIPFCIIININAPFIDLAFSKSLFYQAISRMELELVSVVRFSRRV